jgi:hypothetical protein|nr:MAG TPA_asm: hypothetical protein [Caudoviricetes sp.]
MKSNNFGEIYGAVMKNAKRAAVAATKNAAKKIAKDMEKEALNNLNKYYDSYDPDVYDRTYNLRNAIKPYYSDNSNGSSVSIEIGIIYDASYLNAYSSNSWFHQGGGSWVSRNDSTFNWQGQGNGIPDPEWVLNNFLNGIHPRTTTGYAYAPVQDSKSQIQMMNEFIDNEVPKKIDAYMSAALLKDFTKRMA